MNDYTLIRIWGYYMNLNGFLDDFPNYTVEKDYENAVYVPGRGDVMTMLVYVKETKYLRIDKVANDHKIAYCGINTPHDGYIAPSNIRLDNSQENILDVLSNMEKKVPRSDMSMNAVGTLMVEVNKASTWKEQHDHNLV